MSLSERESTYVKAVEGKIPGPVLQRLKDEGVAVEEMILKALSLADDETLPQDLVAEEWNERAMDQDDTLHLRKQALATQSEAPIFQDDVVKQAIGDIAPILRSFAQRYSDMQVLTRAIKSTIF